MGLVAGRRDAHALAVVRASGTLSEGSAGRLPIGLLAYFLGHAAGNAIETFGIYGLVAVLIAAGGALLAHRRHRRRLSEELRHGEPTPGSRDAYARVTRQAVEPRRRDVERGRCE